MNISDVPELLVPMWLERQEAICDRIEALAVALADGTNDTDSQMSAHKLRGLLGTLGFSEGSETAAEVENTLMSGTPSQQVRTQLSNSLVVLHDELAAIRPAEGQ